jgi:hypothetical protein
VHDDRNDFTLSRAYLADRSIGATLMTIPGGHSIDALCCLGEFKEVSSVVATQSQRVKRPLLYSEYPREETRVLEDLLLVTIVECGAARSLTFAARIPPGPSREH